MEIKEGESIPSLSVAPFIVLDFVFTGISVRRNLGSLSLECGTLPLSLNLLCIMARNKHRRDIKETIFDDKFRARNWGSRFGPHYYDSDWLPHVHKKNLANQMPRYADVFKDNVTLFIGNLPEDMDSEWLSQLFSSSGQVLFASIPNKRSYMHNDRFGFVKFAKKRGRVKGNQMHKWYAYQGSPVIDRAEGVDESPGINNEVATDYFSGKNDAELATTLNDMNAIVTVSKPADIHLLAACNAIDGVGSSKSRLELNLKAFGSGKVFDADRRSKSLSLGHFDKLPNIAIPKAFSFNGLIHSPFSQLSYRIITKLNKETLKVWATKSLATLKQDWKWLNLNSTSWTFKLKTTP
ncbi:hypothetical protein Vadar_022088 [Vaccinium darrowii]|uniref:Uncharacterized protein n=1 Tax=Vaccinium darrowii TaxID=229202 RepID=A0ACB7Y0Z5_9ERIC|nr:hypothetical protein Vadar_022088 [Vaccinium darrowii]